MPQEGLVALAAKERKRRSANAAAGISAKKYGNESVKTFPATWTEWSSSRAQGQDRSYATYKAEQAAHEEQSKRRQRAVAPPEEKAVGQSAAVKGMKEPPVVEPSPETDEERKKREQGR